MGELRETGGPAGQAAGTRGGEAPAPSREVAGALAWSLVAKLLVSLLALVSNVLIVRGLGEDAYGVYSIFLNIAHFLALVIGLGLSQTVLQFLPEVRVRRDVLGARQLLWRGLGLQLLGWLLVLAAVYPLRGWLGGLFHADLRQVLPLGTALLLLECLWTWVGSFYTAMRKMGWLTLASVVQKVVLIALLALLVRVGLDVASVLLVVAGSFFAGLLLLGPGLPGLLTWNGGGERTGLPFGRHMRYGLAIALGASINQILWRSSETLFIGHFRLPADAGFYNAAYNLAQMVLEFVPLAIWPVILAVLSETHAIRGENLLRGTRLYFRLIFVLVVPVALTGSVLGGQVYQVLYGAAMAPGAPLCQMLFLVLLVGFIPTPLRMALFVKERALTNAAVLGAGAVVNIALDLLLIPRYGIWGGAWAVAVALVFTGALQIAVTRRILPGVEVPWAHLGRVLAGSAVVLPLWFVRSSLGQPVPLLAALIVGTGAQFLLLRRLRVFGSEEAELMLRSRLPFRKWIVRLLGRS